MPDASPLDSMLSHWQRLRDQGQSVSSLDLCKDHPELLPQLRDCIEALRVVEAINLPPPPPRVALSADDVGDLPTIPGYDVLRVLGHGSCGIVYLARQHGLERLVALKVLLSPELLTSDARHRLLREARALARSPHPNILRIHEVGEYDGWPFLSLELVSGGTLADRLRKQPWSVHEAADLVRQLADAMHAAHEAGIIHRDLKPANVLLTSENLPKICDFGLARDLRDAGNQTQSGAIVGTAAYMAPEQASGRSRHVGPAADIHALGTILYELLTGRPPFRGETTLDTLLQVTSAVPQPPSKHRAEVPTNLDVICLTCLAKAPADRYASARDLADDLRRHLAGQPVRRRRKSFPRVPRFVGGMVAVGLLVALAILLAVWLWPAPEGDLDQAWAHLASENSREVKSATRQLLRHPEETFDWARDRLTATMNTTTTQTEVGLALFSFDSDDPKERDQGEGELKRLGASAEKDLLDALAKSAKDRQARVKALLDFWEDNRPASQRRLFLHAIDLVAQIGTPEAVALLQELAKPDRPLVVQRRATEALDRLDGKGKP